MEAQIVERRDGHVMGYMARIDPMKADYGELWSSKYMPHDAAVRPLATDPAYYGVYYGTGEEGLADFVAGMLVAADAAVPEGLVRRSVPGGTYAVFDCTMSTIGPTWHDIYEQWMPSSQYAEDEGRPCFEQYASDMQGPDAPVRIYVAVSPK